MRRYARTLTLLALLVILCGLILGFQKIDIPGLERGGDTVLGLSLGLDLQGGSHLVYQAVDPDTGEPYADPPDSQMEGLKRIIEERVNGAGLGEPIIQRLGDDRLLIQLPGVSDTARAKNLIGETARLEFKKRTLEVPRDVDEISPEEIISVTVGPFPLQDAPEEQGAGEQLVAPPALLIQFTAEGAEKFALIMDRLLTSLLPGTSILGSNVVPPNRLEISLEGEQSQRFEATGISGQRIGESNRFGFVLPPGIDPDETRALLGSDPVIRFTELQGAVDEDIGLSGSNLVRAYPSQHAQSGRRRSGWCLSGAERRRQRLRDVANRPQVDRLGVRAL